MKRNHPGISELVKHQFCTIVIFVNAIIGLPAIISYGQGLLLTDDNWVSMNQVRGSTYEKVKAIQLYKGELFVGGDFSQIGSGNIKFLAQREGDSWKPIGMGDSISGSMSNTINALAFDSSGNLYIGGSFNAVGTVRAKNIAKWNGVGWDSIHAGIYDPVNTILYKQSANQIYAAGNVRIESDVPSWIYNYYLTVWALNDTGWEDYNSIFLGQWSTHAVEPCPYPGMRIDKIGFDKHDQLWVASHTYQIERDNHFSEMFALEDSVYYYLIKWYSPGSYSSGKPYYEEGIVKQLYSITAGLYSPAPFIVYASEKKGSPKNAIVVDKKGIAYIGGDFNLNCGTAYAKNIVMWDGKNFYPIGSGVSGPVNTLALDENDSLLYVGGNFSLAGNIISPMIAAVDLKKKPSAVIVNKATVSAPGYRFANSQLTLNHFIPLDKIEIYNIKGQLLLRSNCMPIVTLQGITSQPLLIKMLRNNKLLLSGLIIKQN
jgi:hypothetical protein